MRFIHTADIHLGAQPDKTFPWSQQRQEEIWDTFRDLIQEAEQTGTDLLLIAGDLFHRQPLKGELKEVNYLFSQIPDTQVVLMAGNHDYMKKDSYYHSFKWNDNVTFLDGENLERIYLKNIQTYVYGLSYHTREIPRRMYDEARPGGEPGNHILLAHGGDEKHIPISFGKLGAAGFGYVALGHIHKPGTLVENGMAYAGALEPLDRNDVGKHGYIRGTMERGRVHTEFIPFSRREYEILEIRVNPEMAQSELEDQAAREIEKKGRDNIYSIVLTGYREEETAYQLDRIRRLGKVVHLEDNTRIWIDYDRLSRQYEGTILSSYIRQFPGDAQGIQKKALEYGVEALLQTKR